MFKKTLVTTMLCGIVASALGANVALAGEVTGNGRSLKQDDGTLHGRSICAFSGLNDTYSGDPNVPDEDGFTRTQNWGQIPKAGKDYLRSIGAGPGTSCNPNTGGEGE